MSICGSLLLNQILTHSLSFDYLWQIWFTSNPSRSSAVTNHLMKSKESNLPLVINKSLCCEKHLLFSSASKTITVSLYFCSIFHDDAPIMVKLKSRFTFHSQWKKLKICLKSKSNFLDPAPWRLYFGYSHGRSFYWMHADFNSSSNNLSVQRCDCSWAQRLSTLGNSQPGFLQS